MFCYLSGKKINYPVGGELSGINPILVERGWCYDLNNGIIYSSGITKMIIIKRKRIKNGFIILLSFVLALILSETFFRTYFHFAKIDINIYRPTYYTSSRLQADRLRFKSHPFLPFLSKANDERVVTVYKPDIKDIVTYSYHNNSLGFRTLERPYRKPENTKRIITLGGSTTWEGSTNETTWPAILEEKLNKYYENKGIKVEVLNLAVDAGISEMSLNILNMFGVHYEPDLVISYDGVNDVWFSVYTSNILPDFSNYARAFDDKIVSVQYLLPRKAFDSYLISFISASIDRKFKLESYLPDQIWKQSDALSDKTFPNGMPLFIRNIKLMRSTCREYGCNFVASIPHWFAPHAGVIQFDDNARKSFAEEKINFLDLENILPHNDRTIHTDEFHWTRKGFEAISDEWFKKIVDENLIYKQASALPPVKL